MPGHIARGLAGDDVDEHQGPLDETGVAERRQVSESRVSDAGDPKLVVKGDALVWRQIGVGGIDRESVVELAVVARGLEDVDRGINGVKSAPATTNLLTSRSAAINQRNPTKAKAMTAPRMPTPTGPILDHRESRPVGRISPATDG